MEAILESLKNWVRTGLGYPTQAQIHLTNFCNLKCFFCPTRALLGGTDLKKENELTKEDWISLIDDANELGVKDWHICGGGEPLFFKDTALAVMERIKTSERRGELITNGTLFDEITINKIVKIKWDKIFFSLDSPFAKTQNDLRGAECFDKIIENIKIFVKVKKENKSLLPILCFHMVICNKNYKQIPEMIKLAKRLEVQDVLLNALNIWKPDVERLKLGETQEKELVAILKESKKLAEGLDVSTNIDEFLQSELFKKANIMNDVLEQRVTSKSANEFLNAPCYYPWYNISIFADGVVQPCFIPLGKGEQIKGKSLRNIWLGECFSDIREEMKKGKLSKYCSKCNPWNLSKMGEIRKKLRTLVE